VRPLAKAIASALPGLKIGFADTDNGKSTEGADFHRAWTGSMVFLGECADDGLTGGHLWDVFGDCDLVLVNANHFQAHRQIVLIHPEGKGTLHQKADYLTDVAFVILAEGEGEVPDFLLEQNPTLFEKPVTKLEDKDRITGLVLAEYQHSIPPIHGLVLAGGKSLRMGRDKGLIDYHGKPQREHMAHLLDRYCKSTYLSLLQPDTESQYATVTDSFVGLGPFGGILSAFRSNPNVAWLTVATDIPLIDEATLSHLVKQRNPSKTATCFLNPDTGLPEPLITLWEPRAYRILLSILAQGSPSPRKALTSSDVEILLPSEPSVLANANTPKEWEELKSRIKT
jgi:molybdopterin-guanine dinucleotide biosynthesis protein A